MRTPGVLFIPAASRGSTALSLAALRTRGTALPAAATAAARRTATAARTSAATTTAEPRIRLRINEQPIHEQVDRLRHDLDRIERAVVERVLRALDDRQGCRHVG